MESLPRVFPILLHLWLQAKVSKERQPVRLRLHPAMFQQAMSEIPAQRLERNGPEVLIPSMLGPICVVKDAACVLGTVMVESRPLVPMQMALPLDWGGAAWAA